MRIPHVIELNPQEAYVPSKVALNLIEEQDRKVRSENFSWDQGIVENLSTLCLYIISQNFMRLPVINIIPPHDRDHLLELLPTDLDLEFMIPLIEQEIYWKRRYYDQFGKNIYKKHLGWTWKCLYLERYIRKICEESESQYKDENTFNSLLDLCTPYIHRFEISQLMQWKPPKTLLEKEIPEIHPIYHINFTPIFEKLPNIVEVDITYGMNNVGDTFEFHMFQMDPKDCENLGEAILRLKHIKVLRLHRSDVKCAHVKALLRKLYKSSSLFELDLSHCKIGNLGARCIGMFLTLHENLKILKLRDNKIKEEGALGISWALISPEGAYLRSLDMSLNPLGHEGAMGLLRGMVRGPLPRQLSLSATHIRGITCVRVGGMLNLNSTLRALDISNNDFGAEGGQAVLDGLQNNNKLISLDIRNTNIPEEIQEEIKEILKRNERMVPQSKLSFDYGYTQFLPQVVSSATELEFEDNSVSIY